MKNQEKQTAWNRKLMDYVGLRVSCNEFEKDGLSTDYYVVMEDGSLSFRNELRSLSVAATAGQFMNYWDNHTKNEFLKVLKNKKRTGEETDNFYDEYNEDKPAQEKREKLVIGEFELIDNKKYYKDLEYMNKKEACAIIESMENNPSDFFQTIINEFATQYISSIIIEEIIQKLQECKKLTEILVI